MTEHLIVDHGVWQVILRNCRRKRTRARSCLPASIAAGYWEALNGFGTLLALDTAAPHPPRHTSVLAALLTAALREITAITAGIGQVWLLIGLATTFGITAWQVGDVLRLLDLRNQHLVAIVTEQLERDSTDRAQRAVIEERIRIARELHDVVAHHMSVVAVQAGLAQYVFDSDPATAVSALETIAESSRQALDETRLLVKLLRVAPYQPTDDTSAADFAPGLNRLDKLTDRVTATGVPVKLVVNGTARALTASADLCAYRIIQESLTNVLRHAGPARATVTLTYETDRLEVRVIDDGRGTPENPDRDTAGHGLIGMRERAKLCGGALAAGTHPTKGFEVALTLPIEPSALDQAELAKPNIADRS